MNGFPRIKNLKNRGFGSSRTLSRKITDQQRACLWPGTATSKRGPLQGNLPMAAFNKIFSTQRLLQIIAVLGATVLMKLLS